MLSVTILNIFETLSRSRQRLARLTLIRLALGEVNSSERRFILLFLAEAAEAESPPPAVSLGVAPRERDLCFAGGIFKDFRFSFVL